MPTLAEIRDSIISQATGQIQSDDGRLEYGFIDKLIADKRAVLIGDQVRMGLGIDRAYFQEMDCLRISDHEVQCEGEPAGVTRRYIEIPLVFSAPGAIRYLGTADGLTQFHQRAYESFLRDIPSRFCEPVPTFSVIGTRAYVNREPQIEFVRMVAVLVDPASNSCILSFEETPYPIPADKVHTLELLVLKQLLSTMPIVPDVKNNATDDTGQSGRAQIKD